MKFSILVQIRTKAKSSAHCAHFAIKIGPHLRTSNKGLSKPSSAKCSTNPRANRRNFLRTPPPPPHFCTIRAKSKAQLHASPCTQIRQTFVFARFSGILMTFNN